MNKIMMMSAAAAMLAMPATLAAQQGGAAQPSAPHTVRGELTLFQMTNFNGDEKQIDDASSTVETDWPIRSLSIHPGDRWQICARPRFHDPCVILDRSVPDASVVGIQDQIGSARPAPADAANTPAPAGN